MTDRRPIAYHDVYRNLDGITALATAEATPLKKAKDEPDTAFVKRIVATYVSLASVTGAHDVFGETSRDSEEQK